MCPHTAIYVSAYCYVCIRILLCMCPHRAMHVSADYYIVSAYCYICVRMLLCSPHAAIYVSSYYYPHTTIWCRHTAIYGSTSCYVCPHTAVCVRIQLYVSSYHYIRAAYCYCIYVLILSATVTRKRCARRHPPARGELNLYAAAL